MSILHRKVMYDTSERTNPETGRKTIEFSQWAETTTTLGTMYEPFAANNRMAGTFDPTDAMSRIDSLSQVSKDQFFGDNTIGGKVRTLAP